MEIKCAVTALAALAQETRLAVFRLLVEAGPEGLCAGDIGARLGVPAATLSFHLSQLANAGLVQSRQQSRFIFYSADFAVMNGIVGFLTENCCGGKPCPPTMTQRTFNILVLCTGNSARSILGEALFNHLGGGRVRAFSAGSKPAGRVNPVALETLERHGISLPDARSKSWDEFAVSGRLTFDFIFTVCDNAANEACPVWPGHPATAHWGIPDPAHVEPMAARRAAFETAYRQLRRRIEAFLALPLETLSREDAIAAARRIHEEH